MNRLNGYRNFCNKLWNASRFVLISTKKQNHTQDDDKVILSILDRWILSELNDAVKTYHESMKDYRFDILAKTVYDFCWNQFCDWYLELVKPIIKDYNNPESLGSRYTLIKVLSALLRLSHPIIPFITEAIWQRLGLHKGIEPGTIMLEPLPVFDISKKDIFAEAEVKWIKEVATMVRNIRIEMSIPRNKPLRVMVCNPSTKTKQRVQDNRSTLSSFLCLERVEVIENNIIMPSCLPYVIGGEEYLILMEGIVNKKSEIDRLKKELVRLEANIRSIGVKLDNTGFTLQAPDSVVAKERNRLVNLKLSKDKISRQLSLIKGDKSL
jgi:valyl-tRNA synthetase